LVRIKEGSFTNYTEKDGLALNRVNIISEYKGRFYVGSDDGNIDIIENGSISKLPLKTPFGKTGIRDFVIEEDTLWISSFDGLLKIDNRGNEVIIDVNDGLPANDVRRILKDKNGNLWFGTRSGGGRVY